MLPMFHSYVSFLDGVKAAQRIDMCFSWRHIKLRWNPQVTAIHMAAASRMPAFGKRLGWPETMGDWLQYGVNFGLTYGFKMI